MLSINVKWNKKLFENVEFDPAAGVQNLKSVLFSLTNVPPERQKLMAKGAWPGTLKDDADLTMLPIKSGHQVMLMGTADTIVPSATKAVFIEDMTNEEKAKAGAVIPKGFVNLGNTCYMNSVLQVVRYTPDVRESLNGARPAGTAVASDVGLACTLRDTLVSLDKSGDKFIPYSLVNSIRAAYPQYAQQSQNGGGFMQQDAEEFFNTCTQILIAGSSGSSNSNACRDLMQIEFEEHMHCLEELKEPPVLKHRAECLNKLVCNIKSSVTDSDSSSSAGAGKDGKYTNIMIDGIVMNMEGTIEKRSDMLGRNAVWKKRQRISKLPKYICVQFMRFYWKATPDSRDHAGVKCKIMRPVTFPEVFDVFPLCNDELQKHMKLNRELEQKAMESSSSNTGEQNKSIPAPKPVEGVVSGVAASADGEMQVEDEEEAAALRAAMEMSMGNDGAAALPPQPPAVNPFGAHLPENFTGQYELYGVVTHKGRSADSGHYIGWVRQPKSASNDSDMWWKFDDDVVSEVSTADILDLKGGGDWHTAYMNFYRCKEPKK